MFGNARDGRVVDSRGQSRLGKILPHIILSNPPNPLICPISGPHGFDCGLCGCCCCCTFCVCCCCCCLDMTKISNASTRLFKLEFSFIKNRFRFSRCAIYSVALLKTVA